MKTDVEVIREFVLELAQRKGSSARPSDRDPLISSGILDSIDVLEIVAFLESRYAIDFSARAFDPGDFETIESIVRLTGR
jgi:acyl carrier protein